MKDMKNGRFNCEVTGCGFCFRFSASYKDDIRDKVENQWIYNQMNCIEEKSEIPDVDARPFIEKALMM